MDSDPTGIDLPDTEQQYAPFGELTYDFATDLRLTAGFRYIKSRITLDRVGNGFINGGLAISDSTIDGSASTPKVALTYDVDDNTTTYATVSKGVRLGAPNRPVPVTVCGSDLAAIGLTAAPSGYGSDSLWNYEGGAKSRLLDGRLSVTGDVFYIDWQNIQEDIALPTCGFDFYTNVGSGKSYGSEAEIRFKPASSWTLGLAAGYTHATFTSEQPSLGIEVGDPIPGTPKWNGDASVQYDIRITDAAKGFASADWNWVGSSQGTVLKTDPDYNRPTYNLLGMNAGLDYGPWEVTLFGKNVLNDQKIIQKPNLQSVNRGYTLTPRTLGSPPRTNSEEMPSRQSNDRYGKRTKRSRSQRHSCAVASNLSRHGFAIGIAVLIRLTAALLRQKASPQSRA